MSPEEKQAILEFTGRTFGELKEIDSHIAAAGSNAKFAGRSESLKEVFKSVAAAPVGTATATFPTDTGSPGLPSYPYIGDPVPTTPTFPHIVTVPNVTDSPQKEFVFVDKLQDNNRIVALLEEIRDQLKILNSSMVQKSKNRYKLKACMCGAEPTVSRTNEGVMVACNSCGIEFSAKNIKELKKIWNGN